MHDEIQMLSREEFPALLREIADPPEKLYIRGRLPGTDGTKFLSVVGSRKYTPYGKAACEKLIAGLRGYPVVVVSGLALGIDAIAHTAALDAGLTTVAILGSGLHPSVLYPRTNLILAQRILKNGGALISEFDEKFRATPWSFPQRNRIMAGLAHAVLVIEAEERSGTLITSRLATEYNRDVCTVPGSIFSSGSTGPHMLIRLGATPITRSKDIVDVLGLREEEQKEGCAEPVENCSPEEHMILGLLTSPLPRDALIRALAIPVHRANTLLSLMEIKGYIVEKLGVIQRVR